jgi:hypothetical protein
MPSPAATATFDQAQAAADHARHILDQLAEITGQPYTTARSSPWLAAQLRALVHGLMNRTVQTCPHVTRTPQLTHAAAWRPGTIACTDCAPTLLRPTPTEDHTCDRCHRTAYPIHSALAVIGPILFGYGLCTTCADTTEPPAPARTADG